MLIEVMYICSYVKIDGDVLPLGEEEKIAMETYLKYNHYGLRIIAVAQKHEVPDEKHFSVKDVSEMIKDQNLEDVIDISII